VPEAAGPPYDHEGTAPSVQVGVKLLRPGACLPTRAYEGDAAFDLFSTDELTLPPRARGVAGTGIALDLPPGVAALTLPRSGLAASHGISLVNAPGLIDPSYRGEVKLILHNTDDAESFSIHPGDRIAQLLVVALSSVILVVSEDITDTERGGQGFGSSGRR
jgi:dUTP pyrophosphatase